MLIPRPEYGLSHNLRLSSVTVNFSHLTRESRLWNTASLHGSSSARSLAGWQACSSRAAASA
ncbi:protein of unknown function [Paraburkholderia dioscoreae]|uniref:Uncharacterized protein n=1 Tax=Paraburkholderia dioscoreae TaxID=2604047 RepID=A0A5Q4ZP24_9BURK|nr:protein of unknown function [Paraburkholderia dioscoreae]